MAEESKWLRTGGGRGRGRGGGGDLDGDGTRKGGVVERVGEQ